MYIFNEMEFPDWEEIERQEREEASERHKYKRIAQFRRAVKNRYNKKKGNRKHKQKSQPYTSNLYPDKWTSQLRWKIRARDEFKCNICDGIQVKGRAIFHIHHIDYNKHNCEDDNLITLCPSCHTKTNYNRESWRCYFDREVLRMPVLQ
jgi:5-methylcytosine-specific restriction endonuclease McrA